MRTIAAPLLILALGASCAMPAKKSSPSRPQQSRPSVQSQEIPQPAPSQPPSTDQAAGSPREEADMKEIQALFAKGAFDATQQRAKQFQKKYPSSPLLASIHNIQGLSYLAIKRPQEAILHFKRSIELSPGHDFSQYILYNLAAAQFEAKQIDDSEETLSDIRPDILDRDNQLKFHILRAKIFKKRGLPQEVARETLEASRLTDDLNAQKPMMNQLKAALKSIQDVAPLEVLYKEFEQAPFADLLLYRLAGEEVSQGLLPQAEAHYQTFLARFPSSPHLKDVSDQLRSLQGQKEVDHTAIGILLPMKGKYGKFGVRSLQGIELALRIFNPNEPESKTALIIEDSGEDPEQTIRALEKLYFEHHVAAVIGPLVSKGIDQVTERAQDLGIPLISLAQHRGVEGNYVFHSAVTPKLQAYEIARHAIQKMGKKRFAILFPKDKFGQEYSQYFWDAVESMGGQVVGFEGYEPGETDFRQVVDKISGLHYPEARQEELDALAKEREANNITKRNRKTEQYYALKPVVEFDAVFIPDEPKVIGQILPTFAYKDISGVQFLGISTWNSPDLIARVQNYAQGAVFVDAFYPDSQNPIVRKFVESYKTTFGQNPGIIEALAYDSAMLLEQVLPAVQSKSRREIREKLQTISGFPGVTGKISFQEGVFLRNLKILTIQGNQVREVE